MSSDPCIIILAAPSGSGKTTIASRLLHAIPTISFSVSATTRPARSHEIDGVHYHFMSLEEFEVHRGIGDLLESEEVYPGCWYGTLNSEVEKSSVLAPVLLDIDVVGALTVKEKYGPCCLAIFVSPPSLETLRIRLEARGTESNASLLERMAKAKHELSYSGAFDRVIVNDDLEAAVESAKQIVLEFMSRS